jgi:hypothetical protein
MHGLQKRLIHLASSDPAAFAVKVEALAASWSAKLRSRANDLGAPLAHDSAEQIAAGMQQCIRATEALATDAKLGLAEVEEAARRAARLPDGALGMQASQVRRLVAIRLAAAKAAAGRAREAEAIHCSMVSAAGWLAGVARNEANAAVAALATAGLPPARRGR